MHAVRITGFLSAFTPLHRAPRGSSRHGKNTLSTFLIIATAFFKVPVFICGNVLVLVHFPMSRHQNLCESMPLFLAEVHFLLL